MKIIRVNPGLGNEMYQYAFILNFKLKGEVIKIDSIHADRFKYHNGIELWNIFFTIKDQKITKKQRRKIIGPTFCYSGLELNIFRLIRYAVKFFSKRKIIPIFKRYIQEEEVNSEYNYNSKYLNIEAKISYIFGFFQSYKYFDHMRGEVLKTFTFPEIKKEDKNNFEILEKIKNTESISIHIRRGDFLNLEHYKVCDIEYYKKSFLLLIEKLKERNIEKENINFFIFSDDIAWCMENLDFLKEYKVDFIDWNKKENSYKDMQLMSECKHNIIPNSTFSWWGAYLNKNDSKIILVPEYWWKNILNTTDRCPKNWIRVKIN